MGSGLIPLLLPSGSITRSRSCSLSSTLTSEVERLSSVSPPPGNHRRQFSLPTRRLPFTMPSSLTTRPPQTAAEWRRAVAEVKRKYVSRKYRACWTRCCELLDGLGRQLELEREVKEEAEEQAKKGGDVASPTATAITTTATQAEHSDSSAPPASSLVVYRIYLHFYAASSFEMGARPLSTSSPFRGQLLRDARSHYDHATALIGATEEKAAAAVAATATSQKTRRRAWSGSESIFAALLASNLNKPDSSPSPSPSDRNHTDIMIRFDSNSFLRSPTVASSCGRAESNSGSSRASVSTASSASASAPSSPRTSLCSSLDGAEQQQQQQQSTLKPAARAQNQNQTPTQVQTVMMPATAIAKTPSPKLKKKKVSFSGLPELVADTDNPGPNNGLRPDSPTLGCWEADTLVRRRSPERSTFFSSASSSPLSNDSPTPTPTVAEREQPQQQQQQQRPKPPKPILSRLKTAITGSSNGTMASPYRSPYSPASASSSPSPSPFSSTFDLESFLQAQSPEHVCEQLSGLRSQIRQHRDAVEAMLDAPDETPATPVLTEKKRSLSRSNSSIGERRMTIVGDEDGEEEEEEEGSLMIPAFPAVPASSPFLRRGSAAGNAASSSLASRSSSRSGGSISRSRSGSGVRDGIVFFPSPSPSPSSLSMGVLEFAAALPPPISADAWRESVAGSWTFPECVRGPATSALPPSGSSRRFDGRHMDMDADARVPMTATTSTFPFAYPVRLPSSSSSSSSSTCSSPLTVTPPTTTTTITTTNVTSCPSYDPPSPPRRPNATSHTHSYSYSQRPGTSMSIGSAIGRPASAAATTRAAAGHHHQQRDQGLQARIERLRASGWQRKRFDTRRYEVLREQVLGELDGGGAVVGGRE